MKVARFVASAILILLACGQCACATQKLWKLTDERPVAIRQDRVSEQELQERGLKYTRDDEAGLYRVEKSGPQRAVDWAVRLSVTPATIIVDAVAFVPLLAIYGVDSFAKSGDVLQSGGGAKIVHGSRGVQGPDVPATGQPWDGVE